jgi:uncharacterized cysteine cluster protein YcgN (CxxCxxCC family)
MLIGDDMKLSDWQRKRAIEKRRLVEEAKEAICERCGKAFVYHPYPGFDAPRFHSIICKKLSEAETKDGK